MEGIGSSSFDWDEGNGLKCRKHGLSLPEIEQVFRREPKVLADRTGAAEPRLNAIGTNDAGRHVFVVFTLREREGRALIRPISARYMHRKEVEAFDQST